MQNSVLQPHCEEVDCPCFDGYSPNTEGELKEVLQG